MPEIINNAALSVYVAAGVAVVVMVAFFAYLWRLDRSVRALQKQLIQQHDQPASYVPAPEQRRPQRIEKELSDGLHRS